MKMFITALVMLAVIIGVGIVSANITDDICTDIIDRAEGLYAAISDNRMGEALDIMDDIKNTWDKKEKVLAVVVDHKYLGEVRLSIDKIRQNLMFNKVELAAQNIAALNIFLTEIHDMGHVRLENIF